MVVTAAKSGIDRAPREAYARLEEHILARNQKAASEVFYELVREERPLPEMIGELVRIHAPYTHVPYHQRLDGGVVKFVNNDHCLLSARASLRLTKLVPEQLFHLPLAQTVWYLPTGLDPWNQLLGNVPGHYTRLYKIDVESSPPPPEVHWEDQEPLYLDGSFDEKLNAWLTLVQRGDVVNSYRVFLGLLEDSANRQRLLAQLVFAGMIDIQDRMLYNRSYTTGHKAYRARATVELGNLVGWENAHAVVYAGVPDIAVGPRWYSTYEMACNVSQIFLDGRDQEFMQQDRPLSQREQRETVDLVLNSREPAFTHQITRLLKDGKGPRQIIDVLQVAAADTILGTSDVNGFSMPQHTYEYCNTVRWFYDNFDHPHQTKLLYVAASMVNQDAHSQANNPAMGYEPVRIRVPRGAEALSQQQLLRRLDEAMIALRPDESVGLAAAYLRGAWDRAPLIGVLATAASKIGNDPHNQEIPLCLIEDYRHGTAHGRERLLLAAAKHNAGHRKYGDPLEAYRRFAGEFGIDTRQNARGDGDPMEPVLDDVQPV
jgi:hypothetical protein